MTGGGGGGGGEGGRGEPPSLIIPAHALTLCSRRAFSVALCKYRGYLPG